MRGPLLLLLTAGWLWLPLALTGQTKDSTLPKGQTKNSKPPADQTADPRQSDADEKMLKAAEIKTDGPALVEFLKSRTLSDQDREQVEVLIAQLGASSFKVREQASQALVGKGPVALELLRQGQHHPDPEVQRRCENCLQKIKDLDRFPDTPGAVVRLIGERKPDGAVSALLAFLAFANNEGVVDDIRAVLAKLAVQDGKEDKALVAALADKTPARRGAAGEALVRANAFEKHKQAVLALLTDDNPAVRWRVAVALVMAKEKDAVPVLLELLPEASQSQAWQIEDILHALAAKKSLPAVSLGADKAGRKKFQEAWQAWWKDHGAGVDMAVLSPRLLGLTTIVLLDTGRIIEVDGDDNIRWQINGLEMPLDVQVLDNNRVLIAEYTANRVTERDFKGEILWQRPFQGPQMAQRLPNGNTFIASKFQMLEIDANGKQVFFFDVPGTDGGIMKCMKLANGEIVCLYEDGWVVRMDSARKQLSRFPVDFGTPLFGGRLYALPDGRVLVPHHHQNKVVEYDSTGKVLWQVKVDQPIAALRLANGNTLVTSMNQLRAVEFDRSGAEVWQFRQSTRVTRALRR